MFVKSLVPALIMEQETLSMDVTLSRPASVTWLVNDMEIEQNTEKYEFTFQDRTHQMDVFNVNLSDEGEYSCVVGDNKTSAYVTVYGKYDMYEGILLK